MHEISICQSIISTLENEFPPEQLDQIREVHLKVGVLSCVEPDFVKQVYQFMTADTGLRYSTLQYERVNILVACENCGQNFKVANHVFICPECGTPSSKVIEGNELLINKIILEEPFYEKVDQ